MKFKFKEILISLLCVFLLFAFVGCGDSSEETAGDTETTEATEDVSTNIILTGGELGDYGIQMSVGEDFIGYFVPAGEYIVTNTCDSAVQVTVFKDSTYTEDGIEYPEMGEQRPAVISPGESADISIGDGEYISLSADEGEIELVAK